MASDISAGVRQFVAERAAYRCEYCLLPQAVALHRHEPDHIVPRQHGGTGFLQHECRTCSGSGYVQCELCKGSGQVDKANSNTCFIATAVYEDPFHPAVCILRRFRDNKLRHYSFGRRIIRVYELYSPPLADWISNHRLVRSWIRYGIMPLLVWTIQKEERFFLKIWKNNKKNLLSPS